MEETVADRTLDHTAAEVDLTTDTLPPMEEVEDEEERQPKRARIGTSYGPKATMYYMQRLRVLWLA